jgi:hypothetical protein
MNDLALQQWWTMSGDSFMSALRRVHDGEKPEDIYMEWYANSDLDEEI